MEPQVVELRGLGDADGVRLRLDPRELPYILRVGRAADNDVVLKNRSVSGRHAHIEVGGRYDYNIRVRDYGMDGTGSRFGTLVGETHLKGSSMELQVGDSVRFGTVKFGAHFVVEACKDLAFPSTHHGSNDREALYGEGAVAREQPGDDGYGHSYGFGYGSQVPSSLPQVRVEDSGLRSASAPSSNLGAPRFTDPSGQPMRVQVDGSDLGGSSLEIEREALGVGDYVDALGIDAPADLLRVPPRSETRRLDLGNRPTTVPMPAPNHPPPRQSNGSSSNSNRLPGRPVAPPAQSKAHGSAKPSPRVTLSYPTASGYVQREGGDPRIVGANDLTETGRDSPMLRAQALGGFAGADTNDDGDVQFLQATDAHQAHASAGAGSAYPAPNRAASPPMPYDSIDDGLSPGKLPQPLTREEWDRLQKEREASITHTRQIEMILSGVLAFNEDDIKLTGPAAQAVTEAGALGGMNGSSATAGHRGHGAEHVWAYAPELKAGAVRMMQATVRGVSQRLRMRAMAQWVKVVESVRRVESEMKSTERTARQLEQRAAQQLDALKDEVARDHASWTLGPATRSAAMLEDELKQMHEQRQKQLASLVQAKPVMDDTHEELLDRVQLLQSELEHAHQSNRRTALRAAMKLIYGFQLGSTLPEALRRWRHVIGMDAVQHGAHDKLRSLSGKTLKGVILKMLQYRLRQAMSTWRRAVDRNSTVEARVTLRRARGNAELRCDELEEEVDALRKERDEARRELAEVEHALDETRRRFGGLEGDDQGDLPEERAVKRERKLREDAERERDGAMEREMIAMHAVEELERALDAQDRDSGRQESHLHSLLKKIKTEHEGLLTRGWRTTESAPLTKVQLPGGETKLVTAGTVALSLLLAKVCGKFLAGAFSKWLRFSLRRDLVHRGLRALSRWAGGQKDRKLAAAGAQRNVFMSWKAAVFGVPDPKSTESHESHAVLRAKVVTLNDRLRHYHEASQERDWMRALVHHKRSLAALRRIVASQSKQIQSEQALVAVLVAQSGLPFNSAGEAAKALLNEDGTIPQSLAAADRSLSGGQLRPRSTHEAAAGPVYGDNGTEAFLPHPVSPSRAFQEDHNSKAYHSSKGDWIVDEEDHFSVTSLGPPPPGHDGRLSPTQKHHHHHHRAGPSTDKGSQAGYGKTGSRVMFHGATATSDPAATATGRWNGAASSGTSAPSHPVALQEYIAGKGREVARAWSENRELRRRLEASSHSWEQMRSLERKLSRQLAIERTAAKRHAQQMLKMVSERDLRVTVLQKELTALSKQEAENDFDMFIERSTEKRKRAVQVLKDHMLKMQKEDTARAAHFVEIYQALESSKSLDGAETKDDAQQLRDRVLDLQNQVNELERQGGVKAVVQALETSDLLQVQLARSQQARLEAEEKLLRATGSIDPQVHEQLLQAQKGGAGPSRER